MTKQGKHERRRLFWVDPLLQGKLVLRAIIHWSVILLSFAIVLLLGAAFSDLNDPAAAVSQTMWKFFIPTVLVSLFVLPIILVDTIRHSNQVVGAVVRFRNAMERLADGEKTGPLVLREGDGCWKSMADQFNRIALRMEELEAAASPSPEETSSYTQEEVVSS